MAKRITKAEARNRAAQRARENGTAFNAELASINVEFDVSDTASSSYGGSDSGSSYGSDSGSCGGGYSGNE